MNSDSGLSRFESLVPLIEVNEQWVWWMADKFVCTFKPAH